jgi:hypothetical protein
MMLDEFISEFAETADRAVGLALRNEVDTGFGTAEDLLCFRSRLVGRQSAVISDRDSTGAAMPAELRNVCLLTVGKRCHSESGERLIPKESPVLLGRAGESVNCPLRNSALRHVDPRW